MKKMKIGFFTETYHPQSNGVVTSIDSFGSRLVKKGHSVDIFCPQPNARKIHGMHIHSFRALKFKPYPEFGLAVPIKRRIPKLDIVHTHGPFTMGVLGLTIAKKRKIPCVSTFHTLLPEYVGYLTKSSQMQEFLKITAWSYLKMHYKWYDLVITPSNSIKGIIEEKLNVKKCKVLPTGVDIQELRPAANARKALKIAESEKILLFLGRLSYEKSIEDIIRAMKKLPEHTLLIAGKGPAEEFLKQEAKKNRVEKRVKFLGFVLEEKKNQYYSAADAFVMPSRTDTQGLVVLEAMACGCPVIAANALALPEFVEHRKNGLLFKAGSSSDLAKQVLENWDILKKLRKHARKTAEQYSADKMTEELEKTYLDLTSSF